jgi:hypothetical protein
LLEYYVDYSTEHHIRGREIPKNESLAIEKVSLPLSPYGTVKISEPKVNYSSTVSFDNNYYGSS